MAFMNAVISTQFVSTHDQSVQVNNQLQTNQLQLIGCPDHDVQDSDSEFRPRVGETKMMPHYRDPAAEIQMRLERKINLGWGSSASSRSSRRENTLGEAPTDDEI